MPPLTLMSTLGRGEGAAAAEPQPVEAWIDAE